MAFVQGRTAAARWLACGEWAEVLFGPEGLRLEDWLAGGEVEVHKHGPHRTVYRVSAGRREFFVKHYRCSTFWDTARHLVRLSPARREWDRAERVAQRGIATITPLGWQEQKGLGPVGESFLVTEAIPGGCSLEVYLRERLPALPHAVRRRVRRRLLDDFADFTARIHRAGVRHDDFHPGNFVVSLEEGLPRIDRETGLAWIHLIDLPGVRLGRPLGWKAVRDDLVALNASCFEQVSSRDRYRFWRAYLAARPELPLCSEREALREIAARTAVYQRRRLRRRDKRALQNNRDYVKLEMPGGRAHGVGEFSPESLRQFFDATEALVLENLHRSVKLDHGSMIVEAELPVGGRPVRVAMKRYAPRRWWKILLAPFRQARAVRGWHRGHALRLRGIATARPIAACAVKHPWFRPRSYLAVEWIDGAENLHLYLWRLAGEEQVGRTRRVNQCARQLGAMLGRMHARNVLHSDLKGSNLLVVEEAGRIRTYLVDLDDVSLGGKVSFHRRAADLARLAVSIRAHPWISATAVCRFLRAYQRQIGPAAGDWKRMWRAVAGRSEKIANKKRRRKEAIL